MNEGFQSKDLAGARFADINLAGAIFDDVSLLDCTFTNINLSGAKFRDINFSHAIIDESCIVGLIIGGYDVSALIAAEEARQAQPVPGEAK